MVMDIIIMAMIIQIKNSLKHNKIWGPAHIILQRSGFHYFNKRCGF